MGQHLRLEDLVEPRPFFGVGRVRGVLEGPLKCSSSRTALARIMVYAGKPSPWRNSSTGRSRPASSTIIPCRSPSISTYCLDTAPDRTSLPSGAFLTSGFSMDCRTLIIPPNSELRSHILRDTGL